MLHKADLTYVAVASNSQYTYLAVQRSGNSGDFYYTWLFTQLTPDLTAQSPCIPGQQRLLFNISPNDVLISGHFASNATAMARVFRAHATSTVTAVQAVDFSNAALWTEAPAELAAVAVNTTPTNPDRKSVV